MRLGTAELLLILALAILLFGGPRGSRTMGAGNNSIRVLAGRVSD